MMSSRRATLPAELPLGPRIRRKPPPSIDLEVRYPSPDPTDPFAPLWVLRNRSSNPSIALIPSNDNLQATYRNSSYDLYPSLLPFADTHKEFIDVLSNDKTTHYRRRSQSTPLVPPLMFPSIQSSPLMFSHSERTHIPPVPSLLTDNTSDSSSSSATSTDMDGMLTLVKSSITSSESTPGKFARLLLPKKSRSSSPSIDKLRPSTPSTRIGKISISSPMAVEHLAGNGPQLNDQAARSVNDLHSPQPHYTPLRRTATSDAPSPSRGSEGYHSQPETTLPHHRARSPLSNTHTVELLAPPPPSSNSHSSASYNHVHAPPSPIGYPSSTSYDGLARPRSAPYLSTTSFSSPFLRGHSPRKPKGRPTHSHSPPELGLPIQTEWAVPSAAQLAYAASLPIIAESGLRVTFGSLFATQRTVVIFIRHFWCPLCQDYMTSLTSLAHPDMMYTTPTFSPSSFPEDAGTEKPEQVQLVVISNGAHAFISKYRQIFDMPFSMYTDPSLALYLALGMGRDGGRKIPSLAFCSSETNMRGDRPRTEEGRVVKRRMEPKQDRGYVQHGLVGGIAMVVGRALKAGMPVWEKGGDVAQLGGEFVFGPGLLCTYAHRMQLTKGHAPIRDVLKAAGVNPRTLEPGMLTTSTSDSCVSALRVCSHDRLKKRRNTMQDLGATRRKGSADSGSSGAATEGGHRSLARMSSQEETEWMEQRARSFDILRQKKDLRRAHIWDDNEPTNGVCLGGNSPCSPVVEEDAA